jgi:serine/threonine protein kinase
LLQDKKAGNYKVIEKICDGGMGEVLKGWDPVLKRDLAIKVLQPELSNDIDLLKRFHQEAVILAKLHHQNIPLLLIREDSLMLTAARISDMPTDPMVNPGTISHVSSPILVGCPTVIIGGMPAACM